MPPSVQLAYVSGSRLLSECGRGPGKVSNVVDSVEKLALVATQVLAASSKPSEFGWREPTGQSRSAIDP